MSIRPASETEPQTPRASDPSQDEVGGRYARYVLGVLVLVYVFNFLDRQIISILAEELKRDLGLSDAQLGFLYGTVFAVFYAIFGLPLGRLADVWTRRSVIALGLTLWSGMTALSGLSRNFLQISAARVGVGVGEASATPAAFSMLSDYFPPALRATVLAIYSSGIYIGAGIGIFLGGVIVDAWGKAYPAGTAPFGLRGWQVAFFAVGLPGLLLAGWVRSLREPVRGQSEGLEGTTLQEPPVRAFLMELRAVLPPLTLFHLMRAGASGAAIGANLGIAGLLTLSAWLLIEWLGTPAQWIAMAIGLYAAASWGQALILRDRPAHALIFKTPSLILAVVGFAFLAFSGYGIGFWTPPFFLRVHGVSTAEAGTVLGLTAAAAGWLGVTTGGVWADRWRSHRREARLLVGAVTAIGGIPIALWMLTTESRSVAYVLNFFVGLAGSMWLGAGASTVADLVLPRMRAVASAAYILVLTFIGLALGPYTIGRVSVAVDDLRTAMLLALLSNVIAALFLLAACRRLAHDEDTRVERARAAGEWDDRNGTDAA
jgi:MFS family permease